MESIQSQRKRLFSQLADLDAQEKAGYEVQAETRAAVYDPEAAKRSVEDEVRRQFSYKKPTEEQLGRYQALRTGFANLAVLVMQNTRSSGRQQGVIDNLRIIGMVANSLIADEAL